MNWQALAPLRTPGAILAFIGSILIPVFATPAFVVTGILAWIGGALAIAGGVLALLSSVRPPQKVKGRKSASS